MSPPQGWLWKCGNAKKEEKEIHTSFELFSELMLLNSKMWYYYQGNSVSDRETVDHLKIQNSSCLKKEEKVEEAAA